MFCAEYFHPRFPEISNTSEFYKCMLRKPALVSYPKTEMTIILFLFIEQETTVGRCFEIFHHMLAHR